MPKKKKKSLRNDARGYNTGRNDNTPSSSTKNVNGAKGSTNSTTGRNASRNANYNNSSHTNYKSKKEETLLDKVGKSTRSVQVTTKAYKELMACMDELKQSMFENHITSNDGRLGDIMQYNDATRSMTSVIGNISMDDKRFVKKVTFLVSEFIMCFMCIFLFV